MTAAAGLLAYLDANGVTLQERDQALHYRAPKGSITPGLKAELQHHKAALLELLRRRSHPDIIRIAPNQEGGRDRLRAMIPLAGLSAGAAPGPRAATPLGRCRAAGVNVRLSTGALEVDGEDALGTLDLLDELGEARAAIAALPATGGTGPAEWAAGVARLLSMPRPGSFPAQRWAQLLADSEAFLSGWASKAHELAWPTWELWGVHRRAPWHRLDGMGLVPALQGRELAALTASEAVIRTARGARLTHRRKRGDLLHPAERCLVWELS